MDYITQTSTSSAIPTSISEPEEEDFTNFDYNSIFNDNKIMNNEEQYLPSDLWNEETERIHTPPQESKNRKSGTSSTPIPTKNTDNSMWKYNSTSNDSVNSDENNLIFQLPTSNESKESKGVPATGFINNNKTCFQLDCNENPGNPLPFMKPTQTPETKSKPSSPNLITKDDPNYQSTQGNSVASSYYYLQTYDMQFLVSKCKTHQGSIQFQTLVSHWNEVEFNNLWIQLLPYWIELMCSHYGNYFVQKIFQRLNVQQRLLILTIIKSSFYRLCSHKSGTYSIQALIDVLTMAHEEQILEDLISPHLLDCFCNENAHHVIQKIIINYPKHKREYLNSFVLTHWTDIASNEFGVWCLNKFIIMNSNLYYRLKIMKNLQQNFMACARNKHASSLLLFILGRFGINYSSFIMEEIKNNFLYLSTQADTSEFVDKTIQLVYKLNSHIIISLIWCIIQNETNIHFLLRSRYGVNILLILSSLSTQEQNKIWKTQIVNFNWGQLPGTQSNGTSTSTSN